MLYSTVNNIIQAAAQLIFPSACRSCNRLINPASILCLNCSANIKPVVSLHLPLGATKVLPVFAACAYQDPVKQLVVKKFSYDMSASKDLAHLMMIMIPPAQLDADYLLPVPLHWTRYAYRGYNQTKIIADTISGTKKIPVICPLYRTRKTEFQSRLSLEERRTNVAGVFAIKPWYQSRAHELFNNKRLIIVDDLCTTGATLQQIAKTLQQYKPASITAIVACRAIG